MQVNIANNNSNYINNTQEISGKNGSEKSEGDENYNNEGENNDFQEFEEEYATIIKKYNISFGERIKKYFKSYFKNTYISLS